MKRAVEVDFLMHRLVIVAVKNRQGIPAQKLDSWRSAGLIEGENDAFIPGSDSRLEPDLESTPDVLRKHRPRRARAEARGSLRH